VENWEANKGAVRMTLPRLSSTSALQSTHRAY
jgi:hypothetical protein